MWPDGWRKDDMSLEDDLSPLLDALQSGIPLTPKPFEEIGRSVGLREQDVISRIRSAMDNGFLVRVGPVLDTWAMGFCSSLYGLKVAPENIEAAGKAMSKRIEVTHCYERKHPFNLWFTATVKKVSDLDEIAEASLALPGASELKDLRTLKRLKLNARFSLSKTSFGDGSLLSEDIDPSGPEGEDARILSQASEGLALMNRPYREMGDRLGISEDEILERLKAFLRKGWVRRYAGVVSHMAMGFRANALLVREVCDPETLKLAELLKGREDVSHLYLRRLHPAGPEYLCAMIHAKSASDLKELVGKLPQPEKNDILVTSRCFKRSFFRMPR